MRLSQILTADQLTAVFQPIAELKRQDFLGYEGLIRGPENCSPDLLFAIARRENQLEALERACLSTVLRRYVALQLPGKLFVNLSTELISTLEEFIVSLVSQLHLPSARIVLELTEHNGLNDPALATLTRLRQLGFGVALDDLGEGFSNLKMWSLLRPDYVKIDRHFITGLASDGLKYEFVHAITLLAKAVSCKVIAEGVENPEDLLALHGLDIAYAQGFFIAKPQAIPETTLAPAVTDCLGSSPLIAQPLHPLNGYPETLSKLIELVEPIAPETPNNQVLARFEHQNELHILPVVSSDGTPLGLIWRYRFIDNFVRPYRKELYGQKPCTLFMEPNPIILEADTPIHEASLRLSHACQTSDAFGLIITQNGKYLGICHGHRLLAQITQMQIEAARYANPLTQLPGNVPIYTHAQKLLASGRYFVICYIDIDAFKPFNDIYGYYQGDRLITALAQHLLAVSERHLDFIGHLGGDDFVALFQSSNWQERIHRLFSLFEQSVCELLSPEHLQQRGYYAESRTGEWVFHAMPSLSVGAVIALPGQYSSYQALADAASAAKKMAKRQSGHSLFLERRAPVSH